MSGSAQATRHMAGALTLTGPRMRKFAEAEYQKNGPQVSAITDSAHDENLFWKACLSPEVRSKLNAIDWERPVLKKGGRRLFIEAVLVTSMANNSWNRIPARYGKYHAIYMRFSRWSETGAWEPVIAALAGTEWAELLRLLIDRHKASKDRRRLLSRFREKRTVRAIRQTASAEKVESAQPAGRLVQQSMHSFVGPD